MERKGKRNHQGPGTSLVPNHRKKKDKSYFETCQAAMCILHSAYTGSFLPQPQFALDVSCKGHAGHRPEQFGRPEMQSVS